MLEYLTVKCISFHSVCYFRQFICNFPDSSVGKESACNVGDLGFDPWVGKIPWEGELLPTPVFWPREFHA